MLCVVTWVRVSVNPNPKLFCLARSGFRLFWVRFPGQDFRHAVDACCFFCFNNDGFCAQFVCLSMAYQFPPLRLFLQHLYIVSLFLFTFLPTQTFLLPLLFVSKLFCFFSVLISV